MENKLVTIVTPTYNRADKLPLLYESLCNQTSKDFIWLCIDDGSTDNTPDLISTYIHEQKDSESPFSIQYIKKENGGKHSALNVAFKKVQTELLFIVDSDDVLTSDAIATINEDWKQISNRNNICGIGYLRGYSVNRRIGDAYTENRAISNFIVERYNKGVDGDKAEVWVTDKLRSFQYPEVEGERFISESVAWIWLAEQYDMFFVNKIIYITEYLTGGLSDAGRVLRFKCPNLMMYGSLMTMSKRFSLKIRIKETLLYTVYSLFGDKSLKKMVDCPYKILVLFNLFPGYLLYKFWKAKYRI